MASEKTMVTAKLPLVVNDEEKTNVVTKQTVGESPDETKPSIKSLKKQSKEDERSKKMTSEMANSDLRSAVDSASSGYMISDVNTQIDSSSQLTWLNKSCTLKRNDSSMPALPLNRSFSKLGYSKSEDTYSQRTTNAEASQKTQAEKMEDFERSVDYQLLRKLGTRRKVDIPINVTVEEPPPVTRTMSKDERPIARAPTENQSLDSGDKSVVSHWNLMPYGGDFDSTASSVFSTEPISKFVQHKKEVALSQFESLQIGAKSKGDIMMTNYSTLLMPKRDADVSENKGKRPTTDTATKSQSLDPDEKFIASHCNLIPHDEFNATVPNMFSAEPISKVNQCNKLRCSKIREKSKRDTQTNIDVQLMPKPLTGVGLNASENKSEQPEARRMTKHLSKGSDGMSVGPHWSLMPYGEFGSPTSISSLNHALPLSQPSPKVEQGKTEITPVSSSLPKDANGLNTKPKVDVEIEMECGLDLMPASVQLIDEMKTKSGRLTVPPSSQNQFGMIPPEDIYVVRHYNLMPYGEICLSNTVAGSLPNAVSKKPSFSKLIKSRKEDTYAQKTGYIDSQRTQVNKMSEYEIVGDIERTPVAQNPGKAVVGKSYLGVLKYNVEKYNGESSLNVSSTKGTGGSNVVPRQNPMSYGEL